ncbi:GNAT family N-acetyltransferase [Mariniflexile soesokkakense]|uniref:GNAT family N-acetyltransferase n=1 Tax=Mariniflexile soesokkakense TaxID=1343160 RepID=A0ABV0AAJ9_9FLAO
MKNNPFTSKKFVSIWAKHYNNGKSLINFNFIKNVSFTKSKNFPLYTNAAKNLTHGINYKISECKEDDDYKNKVCFVFDVPSYFNVNTNVSLHHHSLKLKKIKQYNGYLANLKEYTTFDAYLTDRFSSRSRRVFRKYINRLETSFNIKYTIYYGMNITKLEYETLFSQFYMLLKKQSLKKGVINEALSNNKWVHLKELVYPLILEKKASLFVIYQEEHPISICLNYLSENIVFGSLSAFDSDFSKFNIGCIDNLKQLEWCFDNDFLMYDFSKGDFDYKTRWCNEIYNFEYHIFYDSESVISKLFAFSLGNYYTIIQYFRNLKINVLFNKIKFFFKNKKNTTKEKKIAKIIPLNNLNEVGDLELININNKKYLFLKKYVYAFLYMHSESLNETEIYFIKSSINDFIIKGKTKIEKLIF